MSLKRPSTSDFIENPFIKKRNLGWTIESPPGEPRLAKISPDTLPATAAVEAGSQEVEDHLEYFSNHLDKYIILKAPDTLPQLPISKFKDLYETNANTASGCHFVIHQHDHPVAGVHYDLRLQINETSSASWAIMYGLPGDPNSIRLNRNATETRIHCLWNHLIETASAATGSLLIWDTGTYTVLPRRSKHQPRIDPSSPRSSDDVEDRESGTHNAARERHHHMDSGQAARPTQQQLLHEAFQNRKIKLRLHGAKLPEPYVIYLRLTKTEDAAGRARSTRKPRTRRRGRMSGAAAKNTRRQEQQAETTDEEESQEESEHEQEEKLLTTTSEETREEQPKNLSLMEKEIREVEDERVRATNAYPGALNTINSVHQRKWFLSLDRRASGFVERKRKGTKNFWEQFQTCAQWEHSDRPARDEDSWEVGEGGMMMRRSEKLCYPFYVKGVQHERSAVTGRLGADILRDEGVTGFIPRKGWMAVVK